MLEEIISLSKILISVPTVTGDVKSLELAIEIAYQDLYDYNVKTYKTNGIPSLLYYNTPEPPERFKILLNTNLDVVAGKTSQYKPFEKDGKLYGRGAYDMKTASAAMILAFKQVAKEVNYPLGLQIVADEETGGQSTKQQIQEGVRADFVISAIPTNLGISNMSKGMLWVKIKASGKAAHAAHPWSGENAIIRMNNFLNRLEQVFPTPKEDTWVTTINVAKVSTDNTDFNSIPENCEALLDIRYIPEDEETIIEKIKKSLPHGFEMEIVLNDLSEYTPTNHPHFIALHKAVEKVTGKKTQIIKKHYADAVRYYKPLAGHGACIGPIGGNAHGEDEWVDIESAGKYYQALKEFLLSVK